MPCTQSHRLNRGQDLATEFTRAQLQARKREAAIGTPPDRGIMSPKTRFRDISPSRQNSRVRHARTLAELADSAKPWIPTANRQIHERLNSKTEPLEPLGPLAESRRFSMGLRNVPENPRLAPGAISLLTPDPSAFHSPSGFPSFPPPPSCLCVLVVSPPLPRNARKTVIFATCQTSPPSAKIVDSRSEPGPQ
jgi:hypothetical protein